MRSNYSQVITVAVVTAVLFAFSASVQGQKIPLDYPGAPLRDPQLYFGDSNLPSMPFSLFPDKGKPSNNDVTVDIIDPADKIPGHVYGGIAIGGKEIGTDGKEHYTRADSINNTVTIKGGQIGSSATGGNVTGGWALIGDVTDNNVIIEDGNIYNIIYGGWIRGDGDAYTYGYNALRNTVTISGGTIRNNVYGAYSQESSNPSDISQLSFNSVTITGGKFTKSDTLIVGGYSALGLNDVSNNAVSISGDVIFDKSVRIYGGRGQTNSPITGNEVNIYSGTITSGEIYGGELIRGSGTGAVTANTVTIYDGTVNATIYGGNAGAAGASSANAVTGNTISILGGTVSGNLFAGYSAGIGSVTANIVNIDSAAVSGNLYGGYGSGNVFDDNTLNLSNFGSIDVNSVSNFEKINFGTGGTAKIGLLDTTASGSGKAGVTVNVDDGGIANEVEFLGTLIGTGNLEKDGAGILAFRGGDNDKFYGNLNVWEGAVAFDSSGQLTTALGKAVALRADDTALRFDADMDISGKNIVVDVGFGHEGILNTLTNTVTTDNIDVQSGHIAKIGDGTLIFTGDNTNLSAGTVYVKTGTLQLGNNTAAGRITASGGFEVSSGAFLAYYHSNNFTESQTITGDGTVIQRGTGSLTLTNFNTFTGGTEIERGTVEIVNSYSYGWANGTASSGYITFTGADKGKILVSDATRFELALGVWIPVLGNSFRTETGAGNNDDDNVIDITNFTAPGEPLMFMGINIADDGGVFYVDSETAMTVNVDVNRLIMVGNTAKGVSNDLYVESGGTFNLNIVADEGLVTFGSGVKGSGTLNISSVNSGGVEFQSNAGTSFS
ncbi:MAG: hypothetical protein FWE67_13965, partial [Planctomycetaceae bacterium]|nr:hypothetical protein [Planctomycetaceae bacterium]